MYSAQWSMFRHSNSSIRSSLLVSYLVQGPARREVEIFHKIIFLLELFNFVLQRELFLISVDSEDAQHRVPLHHVAVRAQQDLGLVLQSRHPQTSLPHFLTRPLSGLDIFICHLLSAECADIDNDSDPADLSCSLSSKNIGILPDSFIGQNNVI